MTPTSRAAEIAEKILLLALDQTDVKWNDHGKNKLRLIAEALQQYAEEEVLKWRENHKEKWATYATDKLSEARAEGYAQGVEDAVKVGLEHFYAGEDEIIKQIRALVPKTKPPIHMGHYLGCNCGAGPMVPKEGK